MDTLGNKDLGILAKLKLKNSKSLTYDENLVSISSLKSVMAITDFRNITLREGR